MVLRVRVLVLVLVSDPKVLNFSRLYKTPKCDIVLVQESLYFSTIITIPA